MKRVHPSKLISALLSADIEVMYFFRHVGRCPVWSGQSRTALRTARQFSNNLTVLVVMEGKSLLAQRPVRSEA